MTMNKRLAWGMVIYAVVFLAILAVGLGIFWNFIEAYELSRPANAVNAYVEQLTGEAVCEGSAALLEQLDGNIQSREEACQVIRDLTAEGFAYAKKSTESTADRQVYVLRCGSQVVGQFAITAGEPDKYGFRVWSVTEETFDVSFLLASPVSVTVPSDFQVSVNGNLLDNGYITETGIRYGALEEFYDEFDLPTMVTYTAGSCLGTLTMDVTDRDGAPVEITEEMDRNDLLPSCGAEKLTELDTFTREFLDRYVTFTGSANHTAALNYVSLRQYLVKDSALAKRLYTAIDGLNYAQSNGDVIRDIAMNRYADLGDGRYLCDVTYVVETLGRKGAVQTDNHLKLIILETDSGLKVEAMTRY